MGKKSNGRVFLCYLGIKNNTCDSIAGGNKVWGVGGVKKQRSAVGTALCGAFVLDTNSPRPAEMHRSGFWVPFATKRYKEFESLFRLATTTVR